MASLGLFHQVKLIGKTLLVNSSRPLATSLVRRNGESRQLQRGVEPRTPALKIECDENKLVLYDGDTRHRFHALWLRHNCHCDQCKQPFSGQKIVDSSLLHASYTLKSASCLSEDMACVTWEEEEDHVSMFPLSFLRENEYSTESLDRRRASSRPTPCSTSIPQLSRAELKAEGGLIKWLQLINEYGVCLVSNVPAEDGEVRRMAEMIAPIQNSIYGEVWDVKSDPEPINVAYSDAQLDFHMDLSYYESPPGIQFLHCLKFDPCVDGGESLLVDAWHVADTMRTQHPEHFRTLSRVPATFQKIHFSRENPVHMKYQRPHIVLDPHDRIVAVNWAPAFEGPLQAPETDVEAYYVAHRIFAKLLHDSLSKLKFRMKPGDLLSFNNRRVLHGRDAFRLNGGVRHLQGCYVNIDEFKSSLCVETKKANAPLTTIKHVFNHCWF